MQGYLIVKGQIDPIENENPREGIKPNGWMKLYRIFRATIRMHLSRVNVLHLLIVEDTLEHL